MQIYVSGSMAYDRIMDFPGKFSDHILPDKIHILNVCFTVNGMIEKFGGTAGNIAYSLSLLGEKPLILATIGKDYRSYFDWLEKKNIPVDGIKIIEEEFTAGAYITTDRSDNQITGFNPGAMKHPSGYDFSGVEPDNSICLIGPGNLTDMMEYAKICREKKIRYICDPGQSLTAWDRHDLIDWITGSMLLISNDYELQMIINMTNMDKKGLLKKCGAIISTLGEKGSLISTTDRDITLHACAVSSVVDPTGAGDAYRAGLLKGLAMGKDLETGAKMGTVAAAYAVENYGTQEHVFTYDEFVRRYATSFGAM
ncbi:MAG: carbohydrate kinase family protein [Nitrospirae bacterium]|nr:carbohydrate kinase family protein [Nitrospirota bacterium]